MYRLQIKRETKREIEQLPGHVRQLIVEMIATLVDDPRPSTAKELRELPGRYRIALQKWRIIYRVDDERLTVDILRVARKTGPETYYDLE